jgi:murein DD-endopeptidase MepM/ murein hydrolase activator NlpD
MKGKTSTALWRIVLTLSVVILFFLVNHSSSWVNRLSQVSVPALAVDPPRFAFGMMVNHLNLSHDLVKRDQRFSDFFNGFYVPGTLLVQLNALPRKVFDFRRITAGSKYTIIAERDSLKTVDALVYEPNPIDYYIFHFKDSVFVEECQRPVATVEKSVTGEIQSSLSETIELLGISHELTNKFVDIFGWQVDFQRLQKGDKFKLIYEENLVEGKAISVGAIQAIYFEHFGTGLFAFPFDQGSGVDYFDEEGNSLRKALLKYPIEFTSISSRYNLNRFHPVAKVYRPHLGTDFAAPTGTPIRSVGDGIVEEAQFTTNNGNYVKIRHNGTYQTAYLHMSRIGSGITPGTHVRQGQTIGYVGSTGLATGPHVCYRFWRNGVQVDALRVELPPSQPVKKERREEFEKVKETLINRLALIPFTASSPEVIVAVR